MNFATLSTDHLEVLLKNPRGRQDAEEIREELKKRRHNLKDTGTLPLFELPVEGKERKR